MRNCNEPFSLDVKIDFGSVWKFKNKKLVNGIVGDELESNSGTEPEQNGGSNSGEPEYNKNLDDETTEPEHNEDIGEREEGARDVVIIDCEVSIQKRTLCRSIEHTEDVMEK